MRISLSIILLVGAFMNSASFAAPFNNERWQQYQKQFISNDGRVIDNGNANVSHSEGQGYGMLLAVAAKDRPTFEKLWKWTQQHLAKRSDDLFAWRWNPNTSPKIADKNNATDGDLLIAWALGRASDQFDKPAFAEAAGKIASAVRQQLMRDTSFGKQLLPGSQGFETTELVVVNPSYLLLPAFQELRRWDSSSEWQQIYRSSRKLLQHLSKKYNGLLPDWVAIKEGEFIAVEDKPLRFGYDALRVPLYCYWSGDEGLLNLTRIAAMWKSKNALAWYSLDGGVHASTALSSAHIAVSELVSALVEKRKMSIATKSAPLPHDYYGATLLMLVELADHDRNE